MWGVSGGTSAHFGREALIEPYAKLTSCEDVISTVSSLSSLPHQCLQGRLTVRYHLFRTCFVRRQNRIALTVPWELIPMVCKCMHDIVIKRSECQWVPVSASASGCQGLMQRWDFPPPVPLAFPEIFFYVTKPKAQEVWLWRGINACTKNLYPTNFWNPELCQYTVSSPPKLMFLLSENWYCT